MTVYGNFYCPRHFCNCQTERTQNVQFSHMHNFVFIILTVRSKLLTHSHKRIWFLKAYLGSFWRPVLVWGQIHLHWLSQHSEAQSLRSNRSLQLRGDEGWGKSRVNDLRGRWQGETKMGEKNAALLA